MALSDLDDLALFAAVAEHGGFSAAARALGIPKSRLSRRIAGLEARLDLRLFERTTRRVALTLTGEEVLAHARAALVETEAIEALAARRRAEPAGLVRVSCPIGTERPIVAALPAFLAERPRLRVHLMLTNRRVDLLEEGIDVAIRVRERLEGEADFQARVIGVGRSVLVAAPALLEARGRPGRPEDLAALPLLDRSERAGRVDWTLLGPDEERVRVEAEPRFSTGDFRALRLAAEAGLGVASMPPAECIEGLRAGRLEHVLPGWAGPGGIMHMVYPSRRFLLPGVRAVIDFAAEALAGMQEEETRMLAVCAAAKGEADPIAALVRAAARTAEPRAAGEAPAAG